MDSSHHGTWYSAPGCPLNNGSGHSILQTLKIVKLNSSHSLSFQFMVQSHYQNSGKIPQAKSFTVNSACIIISHTSHLQIKISVGQSGKSA